MVYRDNYIYKSSIAPQVFDMNLAQAELENNVCLVSEQNILIAATMAIKGSATRAVWHAIDLDSDIIENSRKVEKNSFQSGNTKHSHVLR